MPKFDEELLSNKEKPVFKRNGTIIQNDSTTTDNKTLNIYNLVNKKSKKVTMSATLDEELVNKLKSFSIDMNSDVSKLLSDILTQILSDVTIKEENLNIYNERNRRNKTKKK
ncbi:TPA: hypothetical protein KR713_003303 [Clostridioides difficile]|uniref:hypothetical protein n=1 Tax=Clostridioides difficile TaxID=1496 RepID=UPI0010287185|nr:hypothetical protein [Clostridioides difficile]MCP8652606.1 hypothetical protein [Clostridioides difficile]MDM0194080.1 hypothetical protein [Clostridioides difficile]VFF18291.1 Uncharacterised protein [Clostridioides difficile]VFF19101.1 Uncharacterised protein [Clostridioides difficile]VFF29096.1 Uncharacterised protein [Clostridioides difficile]